MNSIILIIERESAWLPETWVEQSGGAHIQGNQFTIELGTEWLSVVRDDQVLDDFDEREIHQLGAWVKEPKAYIVEWKGGGLVERLLKSIPISCSAAVDNDHGLLISVHEVASQPLQCWVRRRSHH